MKRNHLGKKEFTRKVFFFGVILCFLGTSVPPNLNSISGTSNIQEKRISSTAEGFNVDIAYIDNIYADLREGTGIMFTACSYGLVINTGSDPITKADLDSAGIVIRTNVKGAHLSVGFNTDNHFNPIQPNNAWGSVNYQNHFLVDLLKNGEVLQNMTPNQTFFLQVGRDNYTGVAIFNISIQIRDRITYTETTITFANLSDENITLISGERRNSTYHPDQPPILPTITGPHYGKIVTRYNFSLGSIIDPNGDQFYYRMNWGDGSPSGDIGPLDSGTSVNVSYKWKRLGTFGIQVILTDSFGVRSNWSAPFYITIVQPKKAFFFGTFKNISQTDDLFILTPRFFFVIPSKSIFYKGNTIVISKGYRGFIGTSFTIGIGDIAIL